MTSVQQSEWSETKFGTHFDVRSGVGFKFAEYTESGIPLVKIDNVGYGSIKWENKSFLPQHYLEDYPEIALSPDDILVALNRPITNGRLKLAMVNSVDVPSILYQRVGKIVFKDGEFDRAFAFYLFQRAIFDFVMRNSVGSDQPFISIVSLRKHPLLMPPLPEQQKIATILSTWDRAIELTEKLIVAKRKRKQALMQQLLTGKRRFKEFLGKPWKWVELGKLTKSIKRPISWNDEQLYKLASVRRSSRGMFFREPAYGHQIKVKKLFTIEQNDFLISNIQAAYGAMGLVPKKFHNTYISDQYTVLVPKNEDNFDIAFLGFVSETAWFRNQILLACNGFFAERLRLLFSAQELLKRKIFVPPSIEEQRRIVEVLHTAVREIKYAEKRLKHLNEQKRGLMQKLLTGKIRVMTDLETSEG